METHSPQARSRKEYCQTANSVQSMQSCMFHMQCILEILVRLAFIWTEKSSDSIRFFLMLAHFSFPGHYNCQRFILKSLLGKRQLESQ